MGARGRHNLKRKRTREEVTVGKEATASASSEGVDHDDDLMKRNSKKHQLPATEPAAAEEAQPAGSGSGKEEKRKRVVRERLPQGLIDVMIANSWTVYEIPSERLAQRSEESRATYAERKAESEKMVAYELALIDQYLINGYAEDEREVTDDEDDGDDTAEKDRIN